MNANRLIRFFVGAVLGVISVFALNLYAATGPENASGPVMLLTIKGPIGPATSDYFKRGMAKARDRGAAVVILQMDTPGGLDSSMREIIQEILKSPVPVISYVSPKGARAASAGTYILYASHVAAMAPATNLGAATPVQIGMPGMPKPQAPNPPAPKPEAKKDTDSKNAKDDKKSEPAKPLPSMKEKVVNDAIAYIRGLAQLRDRNADWAEKAVSEAASLSATKALKENVIDVVAEDVDQLLEKVAARKIKIKNSVISLAELNKAPVVSIEPDWRTELLSILSNPNIAFIFFLIGVYGLIFEVTHPGAIVPGVIGGISLLIAMFGLSVLPINFAGLGLILLGVLFMVAEAFIPSIGALGIGGVVAFVIGSIILMDTDAPGFQVSRTMIGTIAGVSSILFTLIIVLAVKSRRRPVVSGQEEMIGAIGEVTDWSKLMGWIKIHGERWHATAAEPLKRGTQVEVSGMDGLDLVVQPTVEDTASENTGTKAGEPTAKRK